MHKYFSCSCPQISVDRKVYESTLIFVIRSTISFMLTKISSFAHIGLRSEHITVEIGTHRGTGGITIVGLGDTAVQESKQRISLAFRSSGFRIPTGHTIIVNLAPADVKKVGPRFDLPIALGILIVHELVDIPKDALERTVVLGELALDGSLRHVSGVLPATIAARNAGMKRVIVPMPNGPEAALIPDIEVIAAENLTELIAILAGEKQKPTIPPPASSPVHAVNTSVDFADVRGQAHAKRALEIAAAGGHNILMSGAPGAGKTLLARALRGILPPLTREESIEVSQIYSVANLLSTEEPLLRHRPFRTVHHTASGVSIVGGGQTPGPGEISLAHKGVLFLDELAEFPANVLEVLRQPLEDQTITITRAQGSVTFPAEFLLVAAMNPPEYSPGSIRRIKRRISAPLLDRIDLTISVQPVAVDDLQQQHNDGESSATILERVERARERQQKRFTDLPISINKAMGIRELRTFCVLDQQSETLLKQAVERLRLSARSYHRTIKVARTIADLNESDAIRATHVAEALQYRQTIGIED